MFLTCLCPVVRVLSFEANVSLDLRLVKVFFLVLFAFGWYLIYNVPMQKDTFLWVWIGFCVILGISAVIAWYANWPNWGAYLLTFGIYTVYLFGYFWFTRE